MRRYGAGRTGGLRNSKRGTTWNAAHRHGLQALGILGLERIVARGVHPTKAAHAIFAQEALVALTE
jgi:hypothetical protein